MTEVGLKTSYGVKETSELVSYVIHAVRVGGDILEDQKITLSDAGSIWGLLDGLNDATQGIDQIPGELKDLDVAEADKLIEIIMTNYSFPSDQAKEVVDKTLKALRACYELFTLVRG